MWHKIMVIADWFGEMGERYTLIRDFNRAGKNAFIVGKAPTLLEGKKTLMKKLIIYFLLITTTSSFAQSVTCNDLLDFIKVKGYQKSSISNYTLNLHIQF